MKLSIEHKIIPTNSDAAKGGDIALLRGQLAASHTALVAKLTEIEGNQNILANKFVEIATVLYPTKESRAWAARLGRVNRFDGIESEVNDVRLNLSHRIEGVAEMVGAVRNDMIRGTDLFVLLERMDTFKSAQEAMAEGLKVLTNTLEAQRAELSAAVQGFVNREAMLAEAITKIAERLDALEDEATDAAAEREHATKRKRR